MKPQARGAWHCHLLYIWDKKAPYVANKTLRDIWQQGFVKIKKLDDVDNSEHIAKHELDIEKLNNELAEIEKKLKAFHNKIRN